jgi:hypothetical protein
MPDRQPSNAAELIATHNAALADIDNQLVADYDALDASNASLADLAQVASVIDNVRARQAALPTSTGTQPDNPTRPSLTALSRAAATTNPASTARATTRPRSTSLIAHGRQSIPTGEPDIATALLNQLTSGRFNARAGNTDDQAVVASVQWDYPPERQLTTDDAAITTQQLTAALSNQALVAYGGICGPVAVDYDIPSFSSSTRPVRDGLPGYQATRGGITHNPPVKLSDAGGGTSIWTEATDQAGTATKPCFEITCPTPQTVLVYGVPTCTILGNMQQRYSPELVQAWLNATEAAAARIAELQLLSTMASGSAAVTTTSAGLGAARELLPLIDQAAAGLRYRERMNRTNPTLRTVMPDWVRDMLSADIARELAHDYDTPSTDSLALADTRLNNWFSTRNINPIWSLDDTAGGFSAAQAAGPLAAWPTDVTCLLFAEGSWVFLDGGRIDVGFIRDSALNSTNQVQMFVEPFEAVAFRGIESLALTIALNPSGGSAGTVAPA